MIYAPYIDDDSMGYYVIDNSGCTKLIMATIAEMKKVIFR